MRLIACDPGLMSGISYVDGSRTHRNVPVALELETMQAIKQIVRWSEDARVRTGADVGIVCENYKQRPGPLSNQPDALHTIGALRYYCWDSDISFLLQTPSEGKGFGTDAKLKRVGWWDIGMAAYRKGETSHPQAIDAMRHMLKAAVRVGLVRGEELL
jgi:hypothetical protein